MDHYLEWPATNFLVVWRQLYKAYFFIQEQGGDFVFHNAPLLFHLLFSTEFLAGGLLLVASHVYAVPVSVLWVGLQKKKQKNLDI